MFNYEEYRVSTKKRLLKKRQVTESGCWEWTGSYRTNGYGCVSFLGTTTKVSRVSMRVFKPSEYKHELCVLHTCDNKKCFNPEHLYTGTVSDNLYDAYERNLKIAPNSLKAHCPRGHEYTEDNLYRSSTGSRICKTCAKNRSIQHNIFMKGHWHLHG